MTSLGRLRSGAIVALSALRRLRSGAIVALSALLGLWAGTAHVAAALADRPELGPPLARFGAVRIDAPWAWLGWSMRLQQTAPAPFEIAAALSFGAIAIALGTVAILGLRPRTPSSSGVYGTARWATTEELEHAGFLVDAGVVLCQTDDARFEARAAPEDGSRTWAMTKPGRIIRHNGPEHVFCFAPTRSGKGVGLVIPTLLSWTGSAVVYDIKKELWTATAGWRRTFSHAWRFEPTALDSVRFNPLLEIRRGDLEVRDAQNVADILVDPEGAIERRDHWQSTAHALLVGAILHVLYAEPEKSLAGLARFLSDPARTQVETLERMSMTPHLGGSPHPLVAGAAREMLNKSDNELSGVFSTAMTCLSLYRDPIIARSTAASDFRLEDLMQADHPVSLYLVVPPSDIDRVRPLVRLFLNQLGRRLTEKMRFGEERAYRHRLLFMLDEFPSLGRLAFFESELAYLAGYGIKCFLIAQSLSQIEKAYGMQNSILDNAHVRVTYGALDERTARRISDLLGQATETRKHVSMGGRRGAFWLDHVTESEHQHGRPLLTPGEVLQLPADEALLLVGGQYPYRGRKVMYYQDRRFKDRAWLRPPESPEERAAELLPADPNDWVDVIAPAAAPVALEPEPKPSTTAATDGAESVGAEVSHGAWSDFFEAPPSEPALAGSGGPVRSQTGPEVIPL